MRRQRERWWFMVAPSPESFDPRAVVDSFLLQVKSRISGQDFETWFRKLPIRFVPPDRVVVAVTNRFSATWIDRRFREVINDAARAVLGGEALVEVSMALPEPRDDAGDPPPRPMFPQTGRSGFPSIRAAQGDGEASPVILPSAPINRDFTFSNFVIGPSNRLAHAAALGITEAPGRQYNPLFIYGGVGLGKTHLLHAIVQRLREITGLRTIYLTSEAFMNHFISAIERGDVEGFRRGLRSTDVLIVDDVQFISTRERTQEEFFHTFNSLIADAKQVVISSDCPPKEIPGLKERLVSRFNMGLLTRIDAPGFETRVAIVLKKARARGGDIPEAVAEFIAQHVESNIRELEGAIARLFSLVSSGPEAGGSPHPITLDLARAAIKERRREEGLSGTISIAEIQRAVARFYDVKLAELLSKRRARTVSLARQVCMYLARQLTHYSLQEIGAYLGGRDHTTVIYSLKRIEELLEKDPNLRGDIESIKNKLFSSRSGF